jgi:hypothetical protein
MPTKLLDSQGFLAMPGASLAILGILGPEPALSAQLSESKPGLLTTVVARARQDVPDKALRRFRSEAG